MVLAGLNARGDRSPRQAKILLAMAALYAAFGFAAMWMPLRYVHAEYVENVVEVNMPQGRERKFSAEFSREVQGAVSNLPQACDAGARSGRNIVIVITESLSA
jgi:type II secretory pathway component PulM